MADIAPSSGTPLRPNNPIFSASAVQSWQKAAKFVDQFNEKNNKPNTAGKTVCVNVQNNTAFDLDIFSPVILTELSSIGQDDASVEMVNTLQSTLFNIEIPTANDTSGRIVGAVAILQQSLAIGCIGKAAILGVTPARIDVMDEDDLYCMVEDGNGYSLITSSSSQATIQIITRSTGMTGTDDSWGMVLLGGARGGASSAENQASVVVPDSIIGEEADVLLPGEFKYYGRRIHKNPDDSNHWYLVEDIVITNLDLTNPLVLGDFYLGVYTDGIHEDLPIYAVRIGGGSGDAALTCKEMVTGVSCDPSTGLLTVTSEWVRVYEDDGSCNPTGTGTSP